jgi:hypothetical protein
VLRSVLGAVAVATALSLTPAAAEAAPVRPAYAKPSTDPLDGLTVHPEWGSIIGTNGVLKRGCHRYAFTYAIVPPDGIWAIEVFISGPGFKHLAASAFLDGFDPKTGSGRYKLCRVTTRPGRFKIEAKVSVDDGSGHIVEGRLPADRYRLRAPRR